MYILFGIVWQFWQTLGSSYPHVGPLQCSHDYRIQGGTVGAKRRDTENWKQLLCFCSWLTQPLFNSPAQPLEKQLLLLLPLLLLLLLLSAEHSSEPQTRLHTPVCIGTDLPMTTILLSPAHSLSLPSLAFIPFVHLFHSFHTSPGTPNKQQHSHTPVYEITKCNLWLNFLAQSVNTT